MYREEISKPVNDTLSTKIFIDLFNETLDSLIQKQFTKCYIISKREYLSLPADSESHQCSVQSTQDDCLVHAKMTA